MLNVSTFRPYQYDRKRQAFGSQCGWVKTDLYHLRIKSMNIPFLHLLFGQISAMMIGAQCYSYLFIDNFALRIVSWIQVKHAQYDAQCVGNKFEQRCQSVESQKRHETPV